MKAITGYAALMCFALMLAATGVKGMVQTNDKVHKTTVRSSIEARKAALAELDNI